MTNYPTPPVAWLSVTTYMHHWLCREFGGAVHLHEKPVLSISHLPGAREILRMQTQDDVMKPAQMRWSLSAMQMDCLKAGIRVGPKAVESMYNMTPEMLNTFLPIECPRMALTTNGVMRPWNRVISFGQSQAFALTKLLRNTFWQAVGDYESRFQWPEGAQHTTIAMIEGFCADTGTPDIFAADLRREWQRQRNTRPKGG